MAQIGGTVTFKISDRSYTVPVDEAIKIKIKGFKRNVKMGSDNIAHYSEEFVPDSISGTLYLTPGVNPDQITNAENVTVQVNMKNGKSAMLSGAFHSGDAEIDTKEGSMAFEFIGQGRFL